MVSKKKKGLTKNKGPKFKPERCEIITICNRKGGAGKTSTSVELAASLAKSGYKVLFVDFDPQADSTSFLGLEDPEEYRIRYSTVLDMLLNKERLLETFIVPSKARGVDLIPSHDDLQDTPVIMSNYILPGVCLRSRISHGNLDGKYDFCIIDSPPAFPFFIENCLTSADYYIIPINSGSKYASTGIKKLIKAINDVRNEANTKLKSLGILLTMHDGRTTAAKVVEDYMRTNYCEAVFKTTITRATVQQKSELSSESVLDCASSSNLAADYRSLRAEIIERIQGKGLDLPG